jgi:hypothetical protein
MTAFLQTAISVVLAAILAGRVAVTRTSRLRKVIHANLELLDKLPADHPNRVRLEAETGSWSTSSPGGCTSGSTRWPSSSANSGASSSWSRRPMRHEQGQRPLPLPRAANHPGLPSVARLTVEELKARSPAEENIGAAQDPGRA